MRTSGSAATRAAATARPSAQTSPPTRPPARTSATIRVRVTASNGGGSPSADSAPTATVTSSVSPNLAPDPDLEQSPTPSFYTDGSATFSWTTDASHSPTHALKIVSQTSTLARWMTRPTTIAVTPGTAYTATAFMKTNAAAGPRKARHRLLHKHRHLRKLRPHLHHPHRHPELDPAQRPIHPTRRNQLRPHRVPPLRPRQPPGLDDISVTRS